jgi:hypothetical protein
MRPAPAARQHGLRARPAALHTVSVSRRAQRAQAAARRCLRSHGPPPFKPRRQYAQPRPPAAAGTWPPAAPTRRPPLPRQRCAACSAACRHAHSAGQQAQQAGWPARRAAR